MERIRITAIHPSKLKPSAEESELLKGVGFVPGLRLITARYAGALSADLLSTQLLR